MSEIMSPIDVGIIPETGVPAPILLQSEQSTFLIFKALKTAPGQNEFAAAGFAICEFPGCWITKFGYPNDEAFCAIPRTQGLGHNIYEVANSEWEQELASLNRYSFPDLALGVHRHFLILFHDSSFECIADDIRCETSREPIEAILSRLSGKLAAE